MRERILSLGTGKPVITKKNAVDFSKLIEDVSEKNNKK